MNSTLKTFYDLNAWQKSRVLTKAVYEATAFFPADERYGLTSQMRRASVSIMANIAEGFGRASVKEKIHFYNQAHGSLTELQSHVFIAGDLKYLSEKVYQELSVKMQDSQSLLQGLIRSTHKRLPD